MTRSDFDRGDLGMKAAIQTRRESPKVFTSSGQVKPCALIGRKLGVLFEVPSDASSAIDALLQELDRKACR